MKIKPIHAFLLCLAGTITHAEEAHLFRMSAGARPGDMVFQEVERRDTASTVEVTAGTGSVAAKSMFLLRASCALMKDRGEQAFRIERLARQPVRMVLHFVPDDTSPDQPLEEGSSVSAARCEAIESILKH